MKTKNGFVSISIIYSFFIVFLLIMLAMLAAYTNKRYLKDKMGNNLPKESVCREGDSFYNCVITTEAVKNKIKPTDFRNSEKIVLPLEEITDNESESGMFSTQDDYTRLTGNNSLYYRGNVNNNYVVLGDYIWRIVRINGDNTTRLIYQGEYNKNADEDESKVKGNDYITSTGSFGGNVSKTKYNMGFGNASSCSIQEAAYNSTQSIKKWLFGDSADCLQCIRECEEKALGRITCKTTKCYNTGKCSLVEGINVEIGQVFEKIEDMEQKIGASSCEDVNNIYGAHLLNNIGYMRNKTALLYRYDSKYDNQDKSKVQEYIDYWFENSGIKSLSGSYLADETIFCGDKNRSKCILTQDSNGKLIKNCNSQEDEEGEQNFFEKFSSNLTTLYQKTERYYYSGWERLIEAESAGLVCPDSGDIASNSSNKLLNLSRFNVVNGGNNLLYSNNKLSKSTSASDKKNSIAVTADTNYSNGKYALGILTKNNNVSSKITLKGIDYTSTLEYIGNGDLEYPIGLLSADEVVYAGLNYDGSKDSYLLDHSQNGDFFWTMTLAYTDYASLSGRLGAHYFAFGRTSNSENLLALVNDYPSSGSFSKWVTDVTSTGGTKNIFVDEDSGGAYMRPVVNLQRNVIYCSGSGTENDPYIIGNKLYNVSGTYIGNTCS